MEYLDSIDWLKLLEKLETLATSEAAREKLRKTQAFSQAELALKNMGEVEWAGEVLLTGTRPHMESLDLYSVWSQRLSRQALLKPLELRDIRHFCLETLALDEALSAISNPWTKKITDQLMRSSEPLSAIDQIMSPNGEIRTDASEALFRLTQEKKHQVRAIQDILDGLIKANDMEPILQDRYVTNREGRWVLPIKSGRQHAFDGIIHASSQSKQTVFMEPQDIVPLNNRLRQIEVEIEEEVERLLHALSSYLYSLMADFQNSREALLEADCRLAQAQLTSQLEAHPCQLSSGEFFLEEVRHPLLVLSKKKVIPNSVELKNGKTVLLLSGPNAGGKTVLLKAIGLSAQMARCGLPICAEAQSKIPFFKNIHVALGDSQNVDAALSTFAAHLKILGAAAQARGEDQLVLIDEICGATDPEEGSALARSFIERFAANGVMGVVTSHLGALKSGWDQDSPVINGSLDYDAVKGPTYHFLMGVPGESLAIQTARRAGVDPAIIERAISLLSPEHRIYQQRLEEVDQLKQELGSIRDQLGSERAAAQKAKKEFETKASQLELEKEKLLERYLKSAEAKIEGLIGQAAAETVFRRHDELQKIKAELPEIVKFRPRSEKPQTEISSVEQFAAAFPPGSKVYVSDLAKDAVVQGRPNSKGEIPILAGSMRLIVSWKALKPAQQAGSPTRDLLKKRAYMLPAGDTDRSIDVRGLNVDEALQQLEVQLDTAALGQEDRVKVIHGHGTEALKRSIRNYLSRSVYVKKWLAGTAETGGDGVTWVELKD